MRNLQLALALMMGLVPFASARAWDAQQVLEFVLAHSPLLRAYHQVTTRYSPPDSAWEQVLQHSSLYGRAGTGGTDYRDNSVVLQAGVQIAIPLASIREQREQALKAVEEIRAIDEVRGKVLADIGQLRQQETDLKAAETRTGFYEKKSDWLQERVTAGYEDTAALWDIGQRLTEERSTTERLRALVASQRYRLAQYAGDQWAELLAYLEGKAALH